VGPGLLWNLTEYVRRLGGARGDSPPLAHNVQPVLIAGDASALTSPLLGPLAMGGSTPAAVALEYPSLILTARGPGGCFVRELGWSGGFGAATSTARVFVASSTGALGAGAFTGSSLTLADFGVGTVESILSTGTTATLLTTGGIYYKAASTETIQLIDPVFLAPGAALIVQHIAVNVAFNFHAIIQEIPASTPEA